MRTLGRAAALTTSLALASLLGACSEDSSAGETCDTGCDDAGSSGDGSSDDGGSDSGTPAADGLPCDVQAVLQSNCRPCHDAPPTFGAPMSLMSYDDLRVPAKSDLTRTVFQMVAERIDDAERPMPPGGDMAEADKQVLRDWIAAGVPTHSGPACDEVPEPEPEPVGPDALPCEPTHTFTAHASGSSDKFQVPEQGAENLYQCFTFRSPLTGPTQATAWAPIIDDDRVLHHWILYRTPTPQPDGGVGPCQMPADALFVAGWAPGGKNFEMPEDVGLELGGPDDSYILQIHYHNTAHYSDSADASGVALCTAETPRPQTAGIVTLGTVGINIPPGAQGHEHSGLCRSWITNLLPGPLHVIASFPHMHELGRTIKTEILRGGDEGTPEMLLDVDNFSFENQEFYAHEPEVLIQPGDALRTTCGFDNPNAFPVTFGEETEDEMCFNFVMAYPVEVLGDNRTCGLL